MLEALLVFLVVGGLAAAGLVLPQLPSHLVVAAGWAAIWAGLAVGVPTGFWYHVRLRACLRARGVLPKRWWLRPSAHHERLTDQERPGVLVWFVVGGAGFVLALAGCGAVVLGVLLEAARAGLL